MPNLVEDPSETDARELRKKQDRSRDLFGVQLEVGVKVILLSSNLLHSLMVK